MNASGSTTQQLALARRTTRLGLASAGLLGVSLVIAPRAEAQSSAREAISEGTRAATPYSVDLHMVARMREEGLQRSQLASTFSYLTDVLGARLTNSRDMERAQEWVLGEMERIGLVNTVREPFMDYGVSWDNEYFSLHLMEPDYTPMGRPIISGVPKRCDH